MSAGLGIGVLSASALAQDAAPPGRGAGVTAAPSPSLPSQPSGEPQSPAAPPSTEGKDTSPTPADRKVAPGAASASGSPAVADVAVEGAIAQASAAAEATAQEFKLNIYGFADFSYVQMIHPNPFNTPYNTFSVGNLNLYAGGELGDSWRSLVEVRFMYLPDGAQSQAVGNNPTYRIDTSVSDYSNLQFPVKWGGISIERAWLEKTIVPSYLTVRGGQFLTPYGIWNVDHGSPVIIGVFTPYVVGAEFFPRQQTGLEAYGLAAAGPVEVGYHLTLSNGRGPIGEYQNLDNNFAVGGRLFLRTDSVPGTLTVGGSIYRGKFTDRTATFTIDPTGALVSNWPLASQYDEMALGGDLKWQVRGLIVQGEAIMQDTAYTGSVRPVSMAPGPPGFQPDYRRSGFYGLVGYRTPWFGIMPWAGGEYYRLGHSQLYTDAAAFWGGLNVQATARVVLKAEFIHSWFPTPSTLVNGHMEQLALQAAWSF